MRWAWGLALMVLGSSSIAAARVPEVPHITRRLALMGTTLDLEVTAASRAQALEASEAAVRAIEAAERRLSTWRFDTELSRLDRAAPEVPVSISPALARDLSAALDCARDTGGAFDPTVGPLVEAWGLRQGGRRPSETEIETARRATGFTGLRLATAAAGQATALRANASLSIEEGGFGKGAGLSDALAALSMAPGVSSAILDFGGQVAILGGHPAQVVLADPDRRERQVLELSIDRGSLSTSGNGERGVVIDGERIGHLLDPRTGRPASDFGSLTVWAADPLRADCLSTGLYVLGAEAALAWVVAHPGVEVVALVRYGSANGGTGTLRALASAGWRGRARSLVPGIDIEFVGGKPKTTGGGEPWAGTWSPSPPLPSARP